MFKSTKNVIIIPFAFEKETKGSNNIKGNNKELIYIKNAFVAALSCKKNNQNDRVVFVTNCLIPKHLHNLFVKNDIEICTVPFSSFHFDSDYPWCLAFYKLCALKYFLQQDFDSILVLDCDIYCIRSFEKVFKESINEPIYYNLHSTTHISEEDYNKIKSNLQSKIDFSHCKHFSGGFLCLNKRTAINYIDCCEKIFNTCSSNSIVSRQGDEFIMSLALRFLALDDLKENSYSSICWTGTTRILDKHYYNPDCCLIHLAAEKREGFLKMFKYINRKKKLPSLQKAFKILHIASPSFRTRFKLFLLKCTRKTAS